VLYLQLIILSAESDVSVDSEVLLVTDFMNLKIKLTQSFRGAHRGRMCVRVFIGVCMSIYICTAFLKKIVLTDIIVKQFKTGGSASLSSNEPWFSTGKITEEVPNN
jgi:hypothetical protein